MALSVNITWVSIETPALHGHEIRRHRPDHPVVVVGDIQEAPVGSYNFSDEGITNTSGVSYSVVPYSNVEDSNGNMVKVYGPATTIPLRSMRGNIELLANVTDTKKEVFVECLNGDGGIDVDWGDGSDIESFGFSTGSHVYDTPGQYEIVVYVAGLTVGTVAIYGSPITEITRLIEPATTKLRFCSEEGTGGESLVRVPRNVILPSDLTGMFKGCTALNDPNLSYWAMSNVSIVDGMFQGCTRLNQNLSYWDVSGLNMVNVVDFATDSGLSAENLPRFEEY